MSSRPNILFIITDHHAWYDHNRRGEFEFTTPNFEDFCAQGVRFDRAYSVHPICSPARASMMTGVYPSGHGMRFNTEAVAFLHPWSRSDLSEETPLYGGHLAEQGYRNAYVGKWHCGHQKLPSDYGLEGWSLPDYGKVYMSDAYRDYCRQRGLGEPTARIEHYLGRREWEGKTLVLHDPSPWRFMNGSGVLQCPPEAHEENFVAHLAVEKLKELVKGNRPWSLVASFWGPHQPYYPTEPYAGRINPRSIPEYPSFNDSCEGKPRRYLFHRDIVHTGPRKSWPDWSTWQEVLARAYEQQLQLDDAIGQILKTLDDLNVADNTMVIWLADHGDSLASHGGTWDKSSTCSEEVLRVPMAVRWPGHVAAGLRTNRLVSNMDATATMLDAAGCQIPSHMQSRSVLPLCRDASAAWSDQLVCEHNGHGEDLLQRVVLTGRYKFVACVWDGDELYDLQDDPHEMRNLIDSSGHADILRQMRERLVVHIERTGDKPAAPRLLYLLKRQLGR